MSALQREHEKTTAKLKATQEANNAEVAAARAEVTHREKEKLEQLRIELEQKYRTGNTAEQGEVSRQLANAKTEGDKRVKEMTDLLNEQIEHERFARKDTETRLDAASRGIGSVLKN